MRGWRRKGLACFDWTVFRANLYSPLWRDKLSPSYWLREWWIHKIQTARLQGYSIQNCLWQLLHQFLAELFRKAFHLFHCHPILMAIMGEGVCSSPSLTRSLVLSNWRRFYRMEHIICPWWRRTAYLNVSDNVNPRAVSPLNMKWNLMGFWNHLDC